MQIYRYASYAQNSLLVFWATIWEKYRVWGRIAGGEKVCKGQSLYWHLRKFARDNLCIDIWEKYREWGRIPGGEKVCKGQSLYWQVMIDRLPPSNFCKISKLHRPILGKLKSNQIKVKMQPSPVIIDRISGFF